MLVTLLVVLYSLGNFEVRIIEPVCALSDIVR